MIFKVSHRLFGKVEWTFLTETSVFKIILVSKEVNVRK